MSANPEMITIHRQLNYCILVVVLAAEGVVLGRRRGTGIQYCVQKTAIM